MSRVIALALPLILLSSLASAGDFVAGTEDLPLMPGLVAVAGRSVIFDKPEGRIVEAEAHGAVARQTVRRFYAASLPQLGWHPAGHDIWQRDSERLRFAFHGRDGALTVDFTLSPQQEQRP